MGTKTNTASNGLLELQQDLLELKIQEDNFRAHLQRVAEERSAIERRLKAWPTEKPHQEHTRG